MTMTLSTAADAEIVAAVRAGALMGDRIDLALRFGQSILAAEAKDREHAAALKAAMDEAGSLNRILRFSYERQDHLMDRILTLEALLVRACVNGGGQLLREAGLA